jgi:ribose transport system ATP-binding protein
VTPPPLLAARGVTKAFAAPVLEGVDLEVRPGEVHALVGENGAGKSTLSKILAGMLARDAGTLQLDGVAWSPTSRTEAESAGVRLVLQELNLVPTLSLAENVWLGRPFPSQYGFVQSRRLEQAARAALARVGLDDVDVSRPAGTLGTGQQQLVEIARGFWGNVRLLVLDEPTASLAPREVECLAHEIRAVTASGAAVLYISHRLDEVLRMSDRVSVLRDGRLVTTRRSTETTPAELIAQMVGRELPPAPSTMAARAQRPLLRVSGLRRAPVIRDVSFDAHAGEIVGIAGLMGSGRTETLRCLFGADRPDAGTVWLDGRASSRPFRSPVEAVAHGVGLLPEDRRHQGLVSALPVRANLTLTRLEAFARIAGWVDAPAERREADALAARLGVRCQSVEQPVSQLSGGNQQKVAFGRWVFRGCRVLLCDEPSRGIDLAARAAVHGQLRALADEGVAVVVASSDLPELLALSDRVVVLSRGVVTCVLDRAEASEEAITTAAFAEHVRAS